MIGARWGATAAELAAPRPCDALLHAAAHRVDRAISIDAPVGVVFRWLCQLRAAPYSYDLLDNFGRRSPRTLTPGLERLAPGQRVMTVFAIVSFATDDHLTIRSGRHTAVTYAVRPAGEDGTRLAVRVRFALPRWLAQPIVLGDLAMMRKQLLTFKQLAERDARPTSRA